MTTPPAPGAIATPPSGAFSLTAHMRMTQLISRVMLVLCCVSAGVGIVFLALILSTLLINGLSSVSLSFFLQSSSDADAVKGLPGGMANGIVGSLVIVGLASLIGVPLGMLCGTFLAMYSRKGLLADAIRLSVEMLAGVPSIIVGVLAYVLLVLPYGGQAGIFGSAALAMIMCPVVAKTTEDMLRLVPATQREASLGLGASETQTLLRVILPAARSGIVTGVLLAVARIAGETAPLLFTAGGGNFMTVNPGEPMSALPWLVFDYAQQPQAEKRQLAWGGMLVLVMLVMALNLAVRFAIRRGGSERPS